MASSNAVPQIALEGELLKKGKRGANKSVKAKDLATFSEEQWQQLLSLKADGVVVDDALELTGITRYAMDGALRADPKRKAQWEDAKLTSIRRQWDVDTLENIMVDIAMGKTVQGACTNAFRGDSVSMFYHLILKDPIIKDMYDDARMIQAEKMAIDDLIEIADDDKNDETWDGKGNSAAVNRSRLKVDARKWAAAKLHYKRFGDKVQQDVNANIVVDHAARLEAARRRKEAAHKTGEDS